MRKPSSIVPMAAGLLAMAAAVLALPSVQDRLGTAPNSLTGETLYLRDGRIARLLALGQTTTLADLYFLDYVQHVGSPEAQRAGWPLAFPLGNLATDLDPLFGYAYEAVGITLSIADRLDESNRLFSKGISAVPERWQLYFFLAFNHWYELGDYEEGAALLERASVIPGSPRYLPDLAARLYSSAGRAAAALEHVERVLEQQVAPEVRKELEARRDELVVELDLQTVEDALRQYRDRTGAWPQTLVHLVGTELEFLPSTPIWYDPRDGSVAVPGFDRVRVYKPATQLPEPTATAP